MLSAEESNEGQQAVACNFTHKGKILRSSLTLYTIFSKTVKVIGKLIAYLNEFHFALEFYPKKVLSYKHRLIWRLA